MPNDHESFQSINIALVKKLIIKQFPVWSDLAITPVAMGLAILLVT